MFNTDDTVDFLLFAYKAVSVENSFLEWFDTNSVNLYLDVV